MKKYIKKVMRQAILIGFKLGVLWKLFHPFLQWPYGLSESYRQDDCIGVSFRRKEVAKDVLPCLLVACIQGIYLEISCGDSWQGMYGINFMRKDEYAYLWVKIPCFLAKLFGIQVGFVGHLPKLWCHTSDGGEWVNCVMSVCDVQTTDALFG